MQTVTHSVQHLANCTQTHVEQEKIKSARNKAVMSAGSSEEFRKFIIDLKVIWLKELGNFWKLRQYNPALLNT